MSKENILLFCDNYFNDYKFLNNSFKEGTNVYLILDNLNNKKIHQFFKEKQKKTKLIELKDTNELEENIEDINKLYICVVKKENKTQRNNSGIQHLTKKLAIEYLIRPWKNTFIHFKDVSDEKVQDTYKDLGLINNKYLRKQKNMNLKWKKMTAKKKQKKKSSSKSSN